MMGILVSITGTSSRDIPQPKVSAVG